MLREEHYPSLRVRGALVYLLFFLAGIATAALLLDSPADSFLAHCVGAAIGAAIMALSIPIRRLDLRLDSDGLSGPSSAAPFFAKELTIPLDRIWVAQIPEVARFSLFRGTTRILSREGRAIVLNLMYYNPRQLSDFLAALRQTLSIDS